MNQYRDLVARILYEGEHREWRNGHKGIGCFDHQMKFDLRDEFPALTLKFLPFNSVIGELVGFIRGYDNAGDFRNLGCKIWDQNANEEPSWLANPARKGDDDLGRIYGVQWRNTIERREIHPDELYDKDKAAYFYKMGYEHAGSLDNRNLLITRKVDQLQELVDGLRNDPHGRRHVVSAWNPAELSQMALPPCHMFFQCYASTDGQYLDLKMYQRSCDVFLGIPFNIASYAALLHVLAAMTGRQARHLTMDLGDVHLYDNSIEAARHLLTLTDYPAPSFILGNVDEETELGEVQIEDFELVGYTSHRAIKVEMAV